MGVLIFLINPILYIIYKLILFKNFLKKGNESLLALTLAIINIYIPYNMGDSVRYAFKFYEFQTATFEYAKKFYLPDGDPLYYNVLYFFSYFDLPYSLFVILVSFISYLIIFKLIKKYNIYNLPSILFLIFLYQPFYLALGLRFPLASYLMIYGILGEKKRLKFLYIFLALLTHKASIVILVFYYINKIFYGYLKRINIKLLSIFIIFIGNFFYLNIENLYKNLPNNYILNKAYWYKINPIGSYIEQFMNRTYTVNIFPFLAFFVSYFYLLFSKKMNKDKEYCFLIIFASFILSFFNIYQIPDRYIWIFNVFFCIYLLKIIKSKNIFLNIYRKLMYCFFGGNIILFIYFSTIFYINKYTSIPIIFYPTLFQIIGYDNEYNKEIRNIVISYPEKEKLGKGISAKIEVYYYGEDNNGRRKKN